MAPTPAGGDVFSVVIAIVKLTGVSKVNFDTLSNAVRVAFIKVVKAEVVKGLVAGVESTVTIVRTSDSARRRRLLATATEVEFTVSVPDAGGLSAGRLATLLGGYIGSGGGLESDMNAELATTAPSESVTTEVLSAPAVQSSTTTPSAEGDDNPMLIVYIMAGVGAAVLLIVGVVIVFNLVVIVVVVSVQGNKRKRLTSTVSDTGVEMGDIVREKNGPIQAAAVVRSYATSPDEEPVPNSIGTRVGADERVPLAADPSVARRREVNVVAAEEPPTSTVVAAVAASGVEDHDTEANVVAAEEPPTSTAVGALAAPGVEDHDTKHFVDGAWFTKAECIAHYGGSDEYDGAPADTGEWFYDDVTHAGEVHGPFILSRLQSWASEGHFAVSDLIRNGRDGSPIALSAALGIAEQAGTWFYDDHESPGEVHGPFTLSKLEAWMADGHFSGSDLVRQGRDGESVALSDVLGTAEEPAQWFYDDHETPGEVHGPFTRTQLSGWVADGHFTGQDLVRDGPEGSPVTLAAALGEVAEDAVWFYDDHEKADEKHGPFILSQLLGWVAEGHFNDSDLIRNGRDGAPIAIRDAR
jgi:hypothetical protein